MTKTLKDVEQQMNANTLLENANSIQHSLAKVYNAYGRADNNWVDKQLSPAANCIGPLLNLLEWVGSARQLKEVMPHFDTLHTVDDLRSLLVRINYKTQKKDLSVNQITQSFLPAILLGEDNKDVMIVIDLADNGQLLIYNGKTEKFEYKQITGELVTLYTVEKFDPIEANDNESKHGWFQSILSRFKNLFTRLFILTFAINMFDFAVPFYIMMVYDKVIGTKSTSTLVTFIGCLVVAITAGIAALGHDAVYAVFDRIKAYDDFTPDNDPYGEHNFFAVEISGETYFAKIDYFADASLKWGSEDPGDPAQTYRVLTIMLAREY